MQPPTGDDDVDSDVEWATAAPAIRPLGPMRVKREIRRHYKEFRESGSNGVRVSQMRDARLAQSFFEKIEDCRRPLEFDVVDMYVEALKLKLNEKSRWVMRACKPDHTVIVSPRFQV